MITPRKLEAALSEGLPPSEIAKAHKIPVISVYRLANRYGIELDDAPKTIKEMLIERYQEGASYLQAAEEVECCEAYAQRVFDVWSRDKYRKRAEQGDVLEVIRSMLADGKAPSDCAKRLLITTDEVKAIMKENGITWKSKRGKWDRGTTGRDRIIALYHKGVCREQAAEITGMSRAYVDDVYWRENKKARQ